jgi:large subunit ribosomal protein L35
LELADGDSLRRLSEGRIGNMPKMKTRSGAKKRFQVKKSGAVKFGKANAKHLFTHGKTPKSKRTQRGTGHLKDMDAKKVIKELFPFGAN